MTNTSQVPVVPHYSFLFSFEKSFIHQDKRQWMIDNWHTSIYWSAGYVFAIFAIQSLMASRQAFKLRWLLVLWNLGLATFSIVGTFRVWPEMVHVLRHFGFEYSVCNNSYVEQSLVSGYWTWLFALSKVPELGDTLFIVLRKQQLIFLHWYHHITVLMFTWYSYQHHIAPARWYVCMNFAVHAVMYSYYALRASGFRLPKPMAMAITMTQILQMVVGMYVTYYGYVVAQATSQDTCLMPEDTARYGLIMYASYFALFTHFFLKVYFTAAGSKRFVDKKDYAPATVSTRSRVKKTD